MKIQQLIDELQKLDPDLQVFVEGYEGGFCDPQVSKERDMYLNVNDEQEWWLGKHDTMPYREDNEKVRGIVIMKS